MMFQWMSQTKQTCFAALWIRFVYYFITWLIAVRKAHSTWALLGPKKLLGIIFFSLYTKFESNIMSKCYIRIRTGNLLSQHDRLMHAECEIICKSRGQQLYTGKDSPTAQEPRLESSQSPSSEAHKCKFAGFK